MSVVEIQDIYLGNYFSFYLIIAAKDQQLGVSRTEP
jgi:hypothetical protein